MLYVHFTGRDLLRTRFASGPAPLLELSLAVAAVNRDAARFPGVQGSAARRLPASALPLFTLLSPAGEGPLFLDPVCADFGEGLDRVLAAPIGFVSSELTRVLKSRANMTPWHRDLEARDRRAWQTLATAITAAHRSLLEPEWPTVLACYHADLAVRGLALSEVGLHAALSGLFSGSRWNATTLEIPSARDRDRHLGGTGLTAVPSAYWTAGPLLTTHHDGSTVLIYPALTPRALIADSRAGDPLGELLGRTRATALRVLVEQHNTSTLAAAIGVSIGSASQHAATLRRTGLIATTRAGKAVVHKCTPLGLRLLSEAPGR